MQVFRLKERTPIQLNPGRPISQRNTYFFVRKGAETKLHYIPGGSPPDYPSLRAYAIIHSPSLKMARALAALFPGVKELKLGRGMAKVIESGGRL